jgi:uncharacterized RDD family membrane protein YckC
MYCSQCGYNNPPAAEFCKNCERNLQQPLSGSAYPEKPAQLIYSGFWLRLLAVFLDVLVIAAFIILMLIAIAMLVALNGRDSILHDSLLVMIFYSTVVCTGSAYFILMESGKQGATLGKRWMNLRVLDTSGKKHSHRPSDY